MKTIHYCRLGIVGLWLVVACLNFNQCASLRPLPTNNHTYRLLRLHYQNTNGENGLTTFDYDENGHLHLAVWERLDERRNSINHYVCNQNGVVIRKYREFSDSLTSTQTYELDSKGNVQIELFERSDGIHGETRYFYNSKGILQKAQCNGLNGWFYGIIEYTTNHSGLKTGATITQNGHYSGSIAYHYDAAQNLVREVWTFKNGWGQTFDYEYERCGVLSRAGYSSPNVFFDAGRPFRVETEHYDYAGELTGVSYYQYAADGKLVRKRFERSDGLSTITEYLYDYQKRLTKAFRRYSDGKTAVLTYSFDESGNLTNRRFLRIDGMSGSETFSYDPAGILTAVRYENVDGWLTGELRFTPHAENKNRQASFQNEAGPNANVTFIYDGNKDLTEIRWEFLDGKTQTYQFEYSH